MSYPINKKPPEGFGLIYKITNTVNGKFYIGQTINSASCRFYGHKSAAKSKTRKRVCTYLCAAINKYGIENFRIDVISVTKLEELNSKEEALIKEHGSVYPSGYNITLGGGGVKASASLSESMKKAWVKRKERGYEPPNKGKKASKKLREKLSEAHKGIPVSESAKKKLSQFWMGKKKSKEAVRKSVEGRKKYLKNRTEEEILEWKRKISETKREKKVGKKVFAYSLDGKFFRSFTSAWSASVELGYGGESKISLSAKNNGEYKSLGYMWLYDKKESIPPYLDKRSKEYKERKSLSRK